VNVFVDTSALYALLVRNEEEHEAVSGAFLALMEQQQGLATTNYVLVETTALLQRRIGLAAVRDLAERIVPLVTVHSISEAVHRRAQEHMLRSDRRGLSLVDCTSFEVMEREGLVEALALDADFAEAGFRVLPSQG